MAEEISEQNCVHKVWKCHMLDKPIIFNATAGNMCICQTRLQHAFGTGTVNAMIRETVQLCVQGEYTNNRENVFRERNSGCFNLLLYIYYSEETIVIILTRS